MKILLLGNSGQIGYQLERSLSCLGTVIALNRQQLDLTQSAAIIKTMQVVQADVIVNAAAYTAVDMAEKEQDLAYQINAEAVSVMAQQAVKQHSLLVHFSTDYVFSGKASSPWLEDAVKQPVNHYGLSKLAGEQAIKTSGCQYLIIRTSWVYGTRGNNFLLTIMRLARTQQQLTVVDDQIGAPTWCRHIADVTSQLLLFYQLRQRETFAAPIHTEYHVAASGQASWYQFAAEILQWLQSQQIATATLQAVKSDQYVTAAARPKYSVLETNKLLRECKMRIPHWKIGLHQALTEETIR